MSAQPRTQSKREAIAYDPDCRACPRLANFLDAVRLDHPDYWCRPVPSFGDPTARFLIVGLAPGLHGANASGRPFTGDWCGPLLYSSLQAHGFASRARSIHRNDGLALVDCRIANAVKCLPPANKPELAEIRRCNGYLAAEMHAMPQLRAVLALGTVAHQAVIEALRMKAAQARFAHHARHALASGAILFDSYHVSRYNTQTKRLTEAMFHAVLSDVRALLDEMPTDP